jgi:hypothetical protein
MKYKKPLSTILVASAIITGCMGNGNSYNNAQRGYGYNQNNNSMKKYPSSSISSSVKSSLAYMYEEERLAKEVYLAIYQKQPIRQLSKIASNSETRHIEAVKDLAQKYGVKTSLQQVGRYQNSHIQSLFNQLYHKGIRSKKDALEVGCIVEVTDINDLDRYISQAQRAGADDVLQTYDFLRKGSYNHYWAFDRGLKQLGISNGCCSLGDKYCHNEYPKNERGRGHQRGQGHGRGMGGGGWR